jgi:hypothetical protein
LLDIIKTNLKYNVFHSVDIFQLFQDTQWRTTVDSVMKLHVATNIGNLLTSYARSTLVRVAYGATH